MIVDGLTKPLDTTKFREFGHMMKIVDIKIVFFLQGWFEKSYWNYIPITPFCSDYQSQIIYHLLFILAIERLISKFFTGSYHCTPSIITTSEHQYHIFSFIFCDYFFSEYQAPRHLAPNIYIQKLFLLHTSSAMIFGLNHSCFFIIYVTYFKHYSILLWSYIFYHYLCYVHQVIWY